MRFLLVLLVALLHVTALAQTGPFPWWLRPFRNPAYEFGNPGVPEFLAEVVNVDWPVSNWEGDVAAAGGMINPGPAVLMAGNTITVRAPLTLNRGVSITGYSLTVADGDGGSLTVGDGGHLSVSASGDYFNQIQGGWFRGPVTVERGGTLVLDFATTLNFNTVITNHGTLLIYANHGDLRGLDYYLTTAGARIVNEPGGTVLCAGGSILGDKVENTLTLVNRGTVRITSSVPEFRFGPFLNLSGNGSVDVPEGRFLIRDFNGTVDGFHATGAGAVRFGANAIVTGTLTGNVELTSGSEPQFANARLEGSMRLAGYDPEIRGAITVASGGQIILPELSGGYFRLNGNITNYGTFRHEGNGGFVCTGPSLIHNMPSGVIELVTTTGNGSLGDRTFLLVNEFRIINDGTIRRNGTDRYVISAHVTSTGRIEVLSGELVIAADSTRYQNGFSGAVEVAAGTSLSVNYCEVGDLNSTGGGEVRLDLINFAGSLTGRFTIAGSGFTGNVVLQSGEIVQRGTFGPAGYGGSTTLTVAPGASVEFANQNSDGSAAECLWGNATITNHGRIRIRSNVQIKRTNPDLIAGPALIVNEPDGQLEIDAGANIYWDQFAPAPLTVINRGTLQVDAGQGGSVGIYATTFENTGFIRVASGEFGASPGQIELAPGSVLLTGELFVNEGAAARFGGGVSNALNVSELVVTGSGPVTLGSPRISGRVRAPNLVLAQSDIVCTGAEFSGTIHPAWAAKFYGDLTIARDGVFSFDNDLAQMGAATIVNRGRMELLIPTRWQVFDRNVIINEPSGVIVSTGRWEIAQYLESHLTLDNRGLLELGGDLVSSNDGRLGELGLVNSGVITVGEGSSRVERLGLLAGSVLKLLVSDSASRAGTPHFAVTQAAEFGGTIEPWVRPGFEPALGSEFPIFFAQSFTGQFERVDNRNLGRRNLTPIYRGNLVLLGTRSAPVANADALTVSGGHAGDVSVLANDTDEDGDTLGVTAFTQGTHGAVTANADGSLRYTPTAGYAGPDQFAYTLADSGGGSATGAVSVTVLPAPPVITVPPAGRTVAAGTAVTLRVTATGTGSLAYAWFFNDQPVIGAAAETLPLGAVTAAQAGRYRVRVSNAAGPVDSADAVLVVRTSATVAQGPANQIVGPGSAVTLSVTARGDGPFAYQWRRNGVDIPGATGASHTFNATEAGQFTVVVTNDVGNAESAPATVSLFSVETFAGTILAGPLGGTYRVEYREALDAADAWQTAATVTLTTSPTVWIDYDSPKNAHRFYRAVQVP